MRCCGLDRAGRGPALSARSRRHLGQFTDEQQKHRYSTTPICSPFGILRTGHPNEAAEYCQRTLEYLPTDPATLRTLSRSPRAIASIER